MNRLALLLVLEGCVIPDPVVETSAEAKKQESCDDSDPLLCPNNTDQLASIGPAELALDGTVSKRGFSITGYEFEDGGIRHPVVAFGVAGTSLHYWIQGLNQLRQGLNVGGLIIHIHHDSNVDYELRVGTGERVPFYAPLVADEEAMPIGYPIQYKKFDPMMPNHQPSWTDVCKYVDKLDNGLDHTYAMFTKGDRIDPVSGKLTDIDQVIGDTFVETTGPWFNVSCAGDGMVKLARAKAGATDLTTSRTQRQAIIDMITATYCGDGVRYTHLGAHVSFVADTGIDTSGRVGGAPEAVWTGNGAACLSQRRSPKDVGPVSCSLPPCDKEIAASWSTVSPAYSEVPLILTVP